ncbi:hypothetical protein [Streptomyces sp. NPDC001530]|uniref:hypothetical protein n=1 Tax=Streptomyces sp. NPDC001530 TaxID=3364582 RepID=UPI0036A8A51A
MIPKPTRGTRATRSTHGTRATQGSRETRATRGTGTRATRLPRPRPADGFDRRLIAPMVLGSVLNPVNSSPLRQLLSYTSAYAFLYGFTQWLEEGRGLHAATAPSSRTVPTPAACTTWPSSCSPDLSCSWR